MATGNLNCVVVAVDGSEESMHALRWALQNLRLRPKSDDSEAGSFVVLHAQSPPTIATGLNPGSIPFGGPSHVEVPAFTAAIEAHQRRITEAIMAHALQICKEKNVEVKTEVVVGDPKETICGTVEKLKADLLVMGCRAYGPIKRASTTDPLVAELRRPGQRCPSVSFTDRLLEAPLRISFCTPALYFTFERCTVVGRGPF